MAITCTQYLGYFCKVLTFHGDLDMVASKYAVAVEDDHCSSISAKMCRRAVRSTTFIMSMMVAGSYLTFKSGIISIGTSQQSYSCRMNHFQKYLDLCHNERKDDSDQQKYHKNEVFTLNRVKYGCRVGGKEPLKK